MASSQRRWSPFAYLLLLPAGLWAIAFIAIPVGLAIATSFWQVQNLSIVQNWTFANYSLIFTTSAYWHPLVNAAEDGLVGAAICVPLSWLLAHYARFRVKRHKTLFLGAIVLALWMGYLMRIIGWRIILGNNGPLNSLLMALSLTKSPVQWLLFDRFAIILVQVHLALPFAFMPAYVAAERVPENLLAAGADLGANRRRQALFVELPLLAHGLILSGVFTFIIIFGDYFAPILVGGPGNEMIGNVAADQVGPALDWPAGAAVGVLMMIVCVIAVVVPALVTRAWIWGRERRRVAEVTDGMQLSGAS